MIRSSTPTGGFSRLLDEEKSDFGSFSSQNSTANNSKKKKKNASEVYVEYFQPMLAEFFGSALFAFFHCSTANTIGPGSPVEGNPLLAALSDGLFVTVFVIALGHISGAHINFAVTLAVLIAGGIEIAKVPLYLISQILGSLSGAALAYLSASVATGFFSLGEGVNVGQGVSMEIIITLFLTFTVLTTAVELNSINSAFAIGFSITVGILGGSRISGGCMNPTLSLGPALVSRQWNNYWIYWVGPLVGATISGLLFRVFFSERKRLLFPSKSTEAEAN